MSPQPDPFTSLDSETLDAVTGGVAAASSNAQVATTLQGVQSSLGSLKQGNSAGNGLSQMLPMLMLARGGAGGGGACPCGCGMANCGRR